MNKPTRVPNFANSEKVHLMNIIADNYGHVLEDKKTDRASSVLKEKAWQSIEVEFNATSTSSTYRNAMCLKNCYENRKKELRKTLAEERKALMLTGGGPPAKIKKDDTDEILTSILNKKTLEGLHNPFDDDADELPLEDITNCNNEVSFIFEDDEPSPATIIQIEPQPTTSGLNENKRPRKSLSRRRPATIVKPLTTSDVAKKYDLLLDKRLQLINGQIQHMEVENALSIRKRQLEIEILELELNAKKRSYQH